MRIHVRAAGAILPRGQGRRYVESLSAIPMPRPGNPAPVFDCRAVIQHEVVALRWDQLHDRRTLVVQFDSVENHATLRDDLVALSRSAEGFERHQAKVAVVCRDDVFEILAWASRSGGEGKPGEISVPILVDADARIASLYDMLDADGCPLWGHVIIDPAGRVRAVVKSAFHAGPDVEELMRCVASISRERSRFV